VAEKGPLARYHALLGSGTLRKDPEQARVAGALQRLHDALLTYRPDSNGGFFGSLFRLGAIRETPKGLYIHGAVGRGKSLLMDIFFDSAPVEKKRRVHFNAFMTETHKRIHEWRNMDAAARAKRPEYLREAGDDPIAPIARRICNESWLLCFDEFQVADVADAMILGRLFEKLLSFGAVIVLTSNTPPARLYEGGLNRQLFLPFIALLRDRLEVVELDGGEDYRMQRMSGVRLYNSPLGRAADEAMDDAWRRLTNGAAVIPQMLEVFGRKLEVPRAADGVARFSFEELCGRPLAAADYVALAENFHTVLVDAIPQMTPEQSNEARRFALLVDTLYDERIKFLCSADAPPDALFDSSGKNNWFERIASRLHEMQSEDYLREAPRAKAAPH